MKLDLLTNAGVVDSAMRFVSEHSNKISKKEDDDSQVSKEPDYDEDKDQLEEEQEEQTEKITKNHVF